MRYFLHIGFDGTNYSGWQKQKSTSKTVQEVLEQKLSQIFKQDITAYGCGRTDAGVHASQYVLHINLDEAPDFDLKFRLNKNLPDDIAVFEIIVGPHTKHSRFAAMSRTYDYFIHLNKEPSLVRHSSFYEGLDLDYEEMKKATKLILQTTDCRALCKQPDLHKNTLCDISHCELYFNEENGRLHFTITANRFLRGMVRLCVFFLLQVGTGKMTLAEFEAMLKLENDTHPKHPALPNGLFLSKVEYDFLVLKNQHHLIEMLKQGLY